MAGYVPDSVLPRYYCSADIFCAPATGAESFGIVLLEAMASGLPVVATEVAGYMSVLEPGRDSLTVQPKGWAELGAALIILARDAELRRRMGAYGREKAQPLLRGTSSRADRRGLRGGARGRAAASQPRSRGDECSRRGLRPGCGAGRRR